MVPKWALTPLLLEWEAESINWGLSLASTKVWRTRRLGSSPFPFWPAHILTSAQCYQNADSNGQSFIFTQLPLCIWNRCEFLLLGAAGCLVWNESFYYLSGTSWQKELLGWQVNKYTFSDPVKKSSEGWAWDVLWLSDSFLTDLDGKGLNTSILSSILSSRVGGALGCVGIKD